MRELHTRHVDFSEPQTHSATVSEPHSDKSSMRELHTHNVNFSEPQTRSVIVSEPHSDKSRAQIA